MRKGEKKTLPGSLSVEASMIFSIILMILMSVMLLGFSIYSEGISYVGEMETEHRDVDGIFRNLQLGREVIESVF